MEGGVKTPAPGDTRPRTLADLERGEMAVLDRLALPPDEAQRLMEMGFIAGTLVSLRASAPGGDPRVYRVDGSEIALRRETAARVIVDICPPAAGE